MSSCYSVSVQIFAESPEDAIRKIVRPDTKAIEAAVCDTARQVRLHLRPRYRLPLAPEAEPYFNDTVPEDSLPFFDQIDLIDGILEQANTVVEDSLDID